MRIVAFLLIVLDVALATASYERTDSLSWCMGQAASDSLLPLLRLHAMQRSESQEGLLVTNSSQFEAAGRFLFEQFGSLEERDLFMMSKSASDLEGVRRLERAVALFYSNLDSFKTELVTAISHVLSTLRPAFMPTVLRRICQANAGVDVCIGGRDLLRNRIADETNSHVVFLKRLADEFVCVPSLNATERYGMLRCVADRIVSVIDKCYVVILDNLTSMDKISETIAVLWCPVKRLLDICTVSAGLQEIAFNTCLAYRDYLSSLFPIGTELGFRQMAHCANNHREAAIKR